MPPIAGFCISIEFSPLLSPLHTILKADAFFAIRRIDVVFFSLSLRHFGLFRAFSFAATTLMFFFQRFFAISFRRFSPEAEAIFRRH